MTGAGSSSAASPAPRAFSDRPQAGRALAERLRVLAPTGHPRPAILGLPRGGVPVAYEIAAALEAPLDVLVARKIGAPRNPELGMGAIAEGGVRVLSEEIVHSLSISDEELAYASARVAHEVSERVRHYRAQSPPLPLEGRMAVVVDDGLATGATARAALRAVRARGAAQVVLAVPVGVPDVVRALAEEADAVVCLLEPRPLWAIGLWYENFSQVSDEEVVDLLTRGRPNP